MICINCFHKNTNVVNSRPHKKQPQIWRRRTCLHCGVSFTTHERPALSENRSIYLKDGETDIFNLGKLIISISKAFAHNIDKASYDALWLAQTVENILSTEVKLITPEDIEATVHQVLKRFDELAAVQYAAQHGLIETTKRRGRPSLSWRVRQRDELPYQ